MTQEQFIYWLQGYSELVGERPSLEQWQSIKDHLQTVFHKITPPLNYPTGAPLPVKPIPPDEPFDEKYKVIC